MTETLRRRWAEDPRGVLVQLAQDVAGIVAIFVILLAILFVGEAPHVR